MPKSGNIIGWQWSGLPPSFPFPFQLPCLAPEWTSNGNVERWVACFNYTDQTAVILLLTLSNSFSVISLTASSATRLACTQCLVFLTLHSAWCIYPAIAHFLPFALYCSVLFCFKTPVNHWWADSIAKELLSIRFCSDSVHPHYSGTAKHQIALPTHTLSLRASCRGTVCSAWDGHHEPLRCVSFGNIFWMRVSLGAEPPRNTGAAFTSPGMARTFAPDPQLCSTWGWLGITELAAMLPGITALKLFCSAGAEGVKLSSEARCERGWTVVFRPLQPTASNF